MANDDAEPKLVFPFAAPPAPAAVTAVAPGVLWLRMPLPFPPDHINLWLLADGDGWTIVDAGLARDEVKALWEQLFAAALGGKKVTRVLVTHFHPDHIGLASWLTERWQAPLWMTAAEWYMARAVHGAGSEADGTTRRAFYRANGADEALLGPPMPPNSFYIRGVPALPSAFRRVRGGIDIAIGGRAWTPVIGRGHAPEHACLWCRGLGVLIGGDILLPRITPNISVWPNEPQADPLRDYLDSLGNFAGVPGDTLVLPAHGLPYRGIHTRIAALHAHHDERLAAIVAAVTERPLTAVECFPLLFRATIGPHNVALALGEALAHLHYLESQGRARRVEDNGVWRFAAAA